MAPSRYFGAPAAVSGLPAFQPTLPSNPTAESVVDHYWFGSVEVSPKPWFESPARMALACRARV